MNPQTITPRTSAKQFGQTLTSRATTPAASKPARQKSATAASPDQRLQPDNGANTSQTAPHHAASSAPREVQFRLEAPSANEVLLAGDFTNWDKRPIKLIKGGGGVWHVKHSLAPGQYHYRFLVDGVWQDDPHCQELVPNPYGSANSVVEIR